MDYKVLRGFSLGGGKDVFPGETLDVSDADAPRLLTAGKIGPLKSPKRLPGELNTATIGKKGGKNAN